MKYIIFTKKILKKEHYNNLKNFYIFEKFNEKKIHKIKPKIIFFIHWSEIIKKPIYEKYLCIQFHCTNLPQGRGGSPIQNQILQGIKKTKLSAFKITKKIDSGPICLKENFSLAGSASEILFRLELKSINMIKKIVKMKKIIFLEQIGKVSNFIRRKKKQSKIDIKKFKNIEKLYDFLRMLDSFSYPNAYFEANKFQFKFNNVKYSKNKILANVVIKKND
jgi:methionyl-tRNA formyltransferase